MSLLDFCTDVVDEIGLQRPGFVVGNPDVTARRLLTCANSGGTDLARAHDWTILHREYTFETTADTASYAVPDDWAKPRGMTAWDRTSYRRIRGNATPRQWQALKSAIVASNSFLRSYRLVIGPLAGSIIIDPTPAATGDDLVIEYVSSYWCEDLNGNGKAKLTADDDEIRLDHELFRLGLLWRMRRALGEAYDDDRTDYDAMLRARIKADYNLPAVNIASPPSDVRPLANTQEGDFTL